jgi:hypothetical protein
MKVQSLLFSFAVLSGGAIALWAQETKIISNLPPTTPADILRSKGVLDLSEQSLVRELGNSDPDIRREAANQLATDHRQGAIPPIESALGREHDLNTQVGLAEALLLLGDQRGVVHLHAMCTDPDLPLQAVVSAIRVLSLTNTPSAICADTLLGAMGRTKEPGEVAMAASLLPSIYRQASPEQARRILIALRSLVLDSRQEPVVRINSSRALSEIDWTDSEATIRQAISTERDPSMRSFLVDSLRDLEKRQ